MHILVPLLLTKGNLERERLRLAFVVYGAMNRKDWRTVSVHDVGFEEGEFENHLVPLLRKDSMTTVRQAGVWGRRVTEECREALQIVLPFTDAELEFLDRVLGYGEIRPSLLTADEALAERIRCHPLLEWKALNVRQHKRGGDQV